MLKVLGYPISDEAQQAGLSAIQGATGSFSARDIGRAIEPHVQPSATAWVGMTIRKAAESAAEHIIWGEYQAGRVRPTWAWLNQQYWRRGAPTSRSDD